MVCAEADKIAFDDLLRRLTNLETLYKPTEYRKASFSSYDRNGGNADNTGYIRKEGDWYIIAEMEGPGAITRFWAANPSGPLRIYIDSTDRPLLDIEYQDLFSGAIRPFESPMVFSSDKKETNWSYVPIPYNKSCKIAVQKIGFYQIDYVTFHPTVSVQSFPFPFPKSPSKLDAVIRGRFKPTLQNPLAKNKAIRSNSFTRPIAAGERIELATFAGPAVLRGLRMRWSGGSSQTNRELILYAFWDNETEPSIQVPLFDFFGGGVQTQAIGQERTGWYYCYFPMPFLKVGRLVLENDSMRHSYKVEVQTMIEPIKEFDLPLRTFHAYWNRHNETPIDALQWNVETNSLHENPRNNYVALAANGFGHVVGINLHGVLDIDSDVMIAVDRTDDTFDIRGSGNVGFFDSYAEYNDHDASLTSIDINKNGLHCYTRLFIPFPINFEKNCRVTVEHGSGNGLICDYASTVYWYQEEPHVPFTRLPPLGGRQFRTIRQEQPIVQFADNDVKLIEPIEAEEVPVESNGGAFEPQDMLVYGVDWSNDQQLLFNASGEGGSVAFSLPPLSLSGWHTVCLWITESPSSAMVNVQFNNQVLIESIDLYSKTISVKKIECKTPVFIHAGSELQLQISVIGKNNASSGFQVGIDAMQLRPTIQTAPSLEIVGPVYAEPVQSATESTRFPLHVESADKTLTLQGYVTNEPIEERMITIKNESKSKRIHLNQALKPLELESGRFWVTWKVNAEHSGIYKFYLEPAGLVPYLVQEQGETHEALSHRILVNQIPIKKDNHILFDPATNRVLPDTYRLPLQQGENRLCWMMDCDTTTWMIPMIEGLHAME